MLGYFRFILAAGVVFAHVHWIGNDPARTMVSAFFILSGYLITLTLNKNYTNPIAFYWNRFLRLWPLHATIILVVSVAVLLGEHYPFKFDRNDVVGALAFHIPDALKINAPAWSLYYEILFYLIAPFIVYRISRIALVALFSIGILFFADRLDVLTEGFMVSPPTWDNLTSPIAIPASMIYFMLGAALYHAGKIPQWIQPFAVLLLGVLLLSAQNYIYWGVMAATVLIALSSRKETRLSAWSGEFCYPIYIIHWPVIHFYLGASISTILFNVALWSIVWVLIEHKLIRRWRWNILSAAPTPA